MHIDIQSRSHQVNGSLLEHVVQRVRHLLSDARDHVRNVKVRLFDVNGPLGSQDKRCVVQVKLNHLPLVVTEETQADLQVAVDRALNRAGRTVKRRLERPRDRRRGGPRELAQSHLAQTHLASQLAQLRLSPTSRAPYLRSIH